MDKKYSCTSMWTTNFGELQSWVISYNVALNKESDALPEHFSITTKAVELTNLHKHTYPQIHCTIWLKKILQATIIFYSLIYINVTSFKNNQMSKQVPFMFGKGTTSKFFMQNIYPKKRNSYVKKTLKPLFKKKRH